MLGNVMNRVALKGASTEKEGTSKNVFYCVSASGLCLVLKKYIFPAPDNTFISNTH